MADENILKLLIRVTQDGHLGKIKQQIEETSEIKQSINAHLGKSADTLLHYAARHGHLNIVKYFIEDLNMDVELHNADYKRALHEAASMSHELCVRYLIDKGAKIDCLKKADW